MAKSLSIRPSTEQPEEKLQTNPYPGLRPFTLNEKHLYYGREGQSEKILELLTTKRFVAIIGPSGSGSYPSCTAGTFTKPGHGGRSPGCIRATAL